MFLELIPLHCIGARRSFRGKEPEVRSQAARSQESGVRSQESGVEYGVARRV